MSESVPRPESMVQRTAGLLREQLGRGLYGKTLPGEPRLASELMVSRGTLRGALELLAKEGRISPGRPGAPRRVLASAMSSKVESTRTVGVLIPQPLDTLSTHAQHFLRDLATRLAPDGISLVYDYSAAVHRARPGRLLKSILAKHAADLWVIYEASKPMVEFFHEAGVPVMVCGGPGADENVSHCSFDGEALQRHAIGVFARAGHTQIITATRYRRSLREKATREEFAKRGFAFDPEFHMPRWDNDPDRLHSLLRRRLSSPDRPTAWLINGQKGLVMFFSTLLELGLRIPDDVSLLTMGSDPILSCFRPTISHYATPHHILARATARMIRSHLESPPSKPVIQLLQGDYVKGGSVGPAQG